MDSDDGGPAERRYQKEAEERLRMAVDGVGDGAWDWDIRANQVFYSERWYQSLGYTRGDVESSFEAWAALIHPEDRDVALSAMDAHLAGLTQTFDCEFRLRANGGSYRWTLARGRVIECDEDGQPLRVVGSNLDISLSKRVQKALDEVEERCRSIVQTAGSIIVVIDASLQVREWNPAAERIYGWTREEVLGRNYVDWFLPERFKEPVRGEIDRIIAGGRDTENFENPIITRSGTERDVLWNATRLVRSSGESACLAIGQDITERNRALRQRDIAEHEKEVLLDRIRESSE